MLKSELSKLLMEGMIQRKNPRQLAVHLRKRFGVSEYNAERLMRTELARVQIEAQKQSFEKNEFEDYQFICNGTACGIYKELNGKHFKIKDMQIAVNAPPMHPNCRCSIAAWMDSETGNAKINKKYDKENTASPSDSMKKMLKGAKPYTVIAIHNHPGSSVPSFPDIMACKDRKYKYGLVVCHDGTVYKYSVDNERFNVPIAVSALDLLLKDGYTKNVKKQLDDAGISLEVF